MANKRPGNVEGRGLVSERGRGWSQGGSLSLSLRGRWGQGRTLGRETLILTTGNGKVAGPVPVLYPFQPICFRNKYLLLNNQELNELSAISLKANIPEVEAVLNTDR